MAVHASRARSGTDNGSLFLSLSEAFCKTLGSNGIRFRPYQSEELPHFSRLRPDMQAIVLAYLEESLATWAESAANGESLNDSSRLLWRTLSRMRLTPQPDIFDKITDDCVVEIYTPEFRQIFRNLNFFRYFSCTLEELVSHPTHELAAFPREVLERLLEIAQRLGQGTITETFVPSIPPYVFQEIAGIERLKVEVTLRHFSPIVENGRSIALIVVNNCRIVGQAPVAGVPR